MIRQTCFEPMEIPTGSMRPTFRESDRLIITKTQFGINIPMTPKHITFSPSAVKRGGTVVFTAENLDLPDVSIKYFYIIPATKRFVKRMIGLPGDKLYFYGGKIYGIDKNGKDISSELQQPMLSHLEHIPFINIDGRVKEQDSFSSHNYISSISIRQNNQPIASLRTLPNGTVSGKMLHKDVEDIYNLWGMENYSMTKIIPKEKLFFSPENTKILTDFPEAKYFLEISHHSSINGGRLIYDYKGSKRPAPGKSVSYLPLNKTILKTIWNNLYTSRFISKKGYLEHFGKKYNNNFLLKDRPKIKGQLPDGAYEFFDGVAYRVKGQFDPFWTHPLSFYSRKSKG